MRLPRLNNSACGRDGEADRAYGLRGGDGWAGWQTELVGGGGDLEGGGGGRTERERIH